MPDAKRQNFNISPEQEAEIARLRELLDAPTVKEAILSAVRFYTVIANEMKQGQQLYLARDSSGPLQKLIVPELQALKSQRYKYLVQRPHEWRQQFYVKGRRLPAAT